MVCIRRCSERQRMAFAQPPPAQMGGQALTKRLARPLAAPKCSAPAVQRHLYRIATILRRCGCRIALVDWAIPVRFGHLWCLRPLWHLSAGSLALAPSPGRTRKEHHSMRTRLRLGAVTVVALGALLLATALASPAFAWDATVEVKTKCLDDGRVKVKYTVTAWEADHAADVHATYSLNGGSELSLPSGELDAEGVFEGHFVLHAGTTGNVVVYVTVDWKDSDEFEFPRARPTSRRTASATPRPARRSRTPPPPPRRRPPPPRSWARPAPPPSGCCPSPAPAPARCCWPGSAWSPVACCSCGPAGPGTPPGKASPDEGPLVVGALRMFSPRHSRGAGRAERARDRAVSAAQLMISWSHPWMLR